MFSPIIISTIMYYQLICISTIMQASLDSRSIQDAINLSKDGDTIIVSPGTYYENLNFKGKEITVISSNGPESTIIDGKQIGSVVTFNSNEGNLTVLEGFTITNGFSVNGGGIHCTLSSPIIRNNIIIGNDSQRGGGIYCDSCSPIIRNNMIINNTTTKWSGGGIYGWQCSSSIFGNIITDNLGNFSGGGICITFFYSEPSITNNYIVNNSIKSGSGGGICCQHYSNPTISYNIISQNNYDGINIDSFNAIINNNNINNNNGRGIICTNGTVKILNNKIYNNSGGSGSGIQFHGKLLIATNNIVYRNIALGSGGGIQIGPGTAILTNNTIVKNEAIDGGGIDVSGDLTIINSILWDNIGTYGEDEINYTFTPPDVSYCNIKGGFPGLCNIDTNPLFVDQDADDLHILYDSPCRDAGTNTALELPDFDFEGDPRIAYGIADIGADEFYTHLYYTGDAVPGGQVALKFIDFPNKSPVGLWFGSGILDKPLSSKFGDWYLSFPIYGPFVFAPIPSNGLLEFSGNLPLFPQDPYTLFMQAIIGNKFTNYCKMNVE